MDWEPIFDILDKINAVTGLVSFIISGVTLFFSIRIKNNVENARDEQTLTFRKPKIIGDLQGYSIYIDKNNVELINKHALKSFLIELEETYPFLKRKKKKVFKSLYESLEKDDWYSIKRGISNLIAYIERI
ncbi:hypothetical protein [Enterococcus pallens]|uniref:Uncharacterized protein n=1 Tax=Enterococcus pallens ATCC BAA-351 TaxID=1158607 RepID=R2SMI9_9ENTE|nr:hypothetical protein [Enterococcus pallens]EOH94815.1 hypothetical protein UAU_01737 [Enterococcus pallens ATCC BAA-351]EOH96370.1 hypothetical protein UAU_01020 [Enterococcus pallens ATCC BAA-351]EOU14417.1 hypothetical protein I588_04774 [Enterococcus pallens ATCC BAA-351]EOU14866.1 hypothetical protein I588_04516 [Enterococcus pallens ATCC BAA-351]OJG69737.1 hypothetical protein RV10_GL000737 [Enterococcus pallens]